MKILGNLVVASLLAVVTGAVIFFVTRSETIAVMSKDKVALGHDHKHDGESTRVFESEGERPEPSKTGPHPKLVCEDPKFEFGEMELGTDRSHTFEIRNDGEADLVMKTGTPTCKCTQFELSKPVLKPGESGKVFLTWKPVSESAAFAQRAPIHTNDPGFYPEPFWLEIEGSVNALIKSQPEESWIIGDIADNEPTRFTGRIFSGLLNEFSLVDMKCGEPTVALSTEPMTAEQLGENHAKSGYVVTVQVPPGVPVGKFSQELSFRVESKEMENGVSKESYKIQLRGVKSGPMEFVPTFGVRFEKQSAYIEMGDFSAAQGKTIKLLVFVSLEEGDPPFAVTGIDVDPGFIDVKMVEDENFKGKNRKRYELILSAPPGCPRSAWEKERSARIVIRTNHPDAKEVQLRMGFVAL